jgi:hypothetical protein
LDKFEMMMDTSELAKELVNWELLIFQRYYHRCEKHEVPFEVVEKTLICVHNVGF